MRILKKVYLNISFYAFFISLSLVFLPTLGSLIVIMALFLPKRQILRRLRRAIQWYGAVIIRILPFPLVRLNYKDSSKGNLAGPYLYVCNHRSAIDPFLMAIIPYEGIQVVNIWPFRIPALGIIAKLGGYLSVREMPFTEFMQRACKLLAEGVSMVTFPEGTRSRDNSLGQFNSAIFRVALETRCPIVPLCITGNELVLSVGSGVLNPGEIKIHKLSAITWDEYQSLSSFQLKNHVRDIIAKETVLMDQGNA